MPDLLTHAATGVLLGRLARSRLLPLFVLGSALPDLLRLPGLLLLGAVERGLPVPEALAWAFFPLHLPLGMAAWSLLLAELFPERQRLAAFLQLYAGALLHLGLDLLQHHEGTGYALLFPFSSREFEIGLFGPEASVPWAPLLALLAALVLARPRLRARR